MQASTIPMGMQPRSLQAAHRGRSTRVKAPDSRLLPGVVAIAIVVAMLLVMIPGFAGVPVEGPVVPAPLPAPAPVVVDAAIG